MGAQVDATPKCNGPLRMPRKSQMVRATTDAGRGKTSKLGRSHHNAIAAWEKGASRRAQGWAGENGDRNGTALHPRKSQKATIQRSDRARREHYIVGDVREGK